MSRRTAWTVAAALALGAVARAAPSAAADETVATTKHATVEGDVSMELAKRVADAIEAAMPVYRAQLPWSLPEGQTLVVHLYKNAEDYAAAMRDAGAGAFERNLSVTLTRTKESHVVVQPRSDEAYLRLVGGLPEMTRQLVLHECVHQICGRAGASNERWWPDWYGEGMAEHVACAALAASLPAGTPESISSSSRHAQVALAASTRSLVRLDRLLHAQQTEVERYREYYDEWRAFYEFLASDPKRFASFQDAVRGLGEPGGPPKGERDTRSLQVATTFADLVTRTFGPLDAVETRWRTWAAALRGEWYQPGSSVERVGDEYVAASFPDGNAWAIRAAPAPDKPFTESFEWNLEPGGGEAVAYVACETGDDVRFAKIIFSEGKVTALPYAEGRWQERYRSDGPVDSKLTAPGTWHATRLSVDAKTVRVDLDGTRVFETPVPPGFDPLGTGVGFGVNEGVARVRRFEVKPISR